MSTFTFHAGDSRGRPGSNDALWCTFDSAAAFEESKRPGPVRDAYLECMFMAIVGRTMPVQVCVRVRIPPELMTEEARAEARALGADDGVLHVFGTVSQPELDGKVLRAEDLAMIARAGEARETAERVRARLEAGEAMRECAACGSMFKTSVRSGTHRCPECRDERR